MPPMRLQSGLWQRRRDAAFCRLLERVSDFNQPGFAACHSGKAHAEGTGFWIEAFGEWREAGIGNHRERYNDRRITCPRRDGCTSRAGKQKRVEVIGVDYFIDAVSGG